MPYTEENLAAIFAGQNAGSFTELFTGAARGAGAGICSSPMLLKHALVQNRVTNIKAVNIATA
jgi:hypothetical protein